MSRAFIDFALEHRHDDTARLLLSASRYPGVDMHAAVQQIEGLAAAERKWPSLLQCSDFVYPPRLNREQASSEASARYKATLAGAVGRVADLTGGMGIDCMALAAVASEVDYVERDPMLCELMEHNCRALGIGNIAVHCADSIEWLAAQSGRHDLLMIDPARRDTHGRKVVAFEDCSPDVVAHRRLLAAHCSRLLVKASPMLDIDLAVAQLGHCAEVHVVAVDGECKELLLLCTEVVAEPEIHCVSIAAGGITEHRFTRSNEAAAEADYCTAVGRYLLEPDAALMKAGPYKSLCRWYGVQKLDPNSHLYTASAIVAGFPGRVLEVVGEVPLSAKGVRRLLPDGRASVVCRGYPESATTLQKRLRLVDGEAVLVATSVAGRYTGFLCRKAIAS